MILGGVSVELVQVGSLCHDDVIDEAETRRASRASTSRWGNLKAILAGDFLLAKASEIAASLGTEVAGLLAATIGKLCEGEVNELRHAYDPARTIESYLTAIEGKTAALFATACRVGADDDDLAGAELLVEQTLRQGVLDEALDGATQRSGAERGVVALVGDEALGGRGELDADALAFELLLGAGDHEVDDLGDLGLVSSWNTIVSSMRFRNSGRKCCLSASFTFSFMRS